ncbi:uncharacterized protein MEPE_05548 [Melanopsichium pennsylvanicum]|uniref:Uncharacterized protein n=1 Tax=Melanopsichium pennsylvanicum TaxID=63383 RepID=A0AAJ4XQX2_9BASI|nr:uncharacterized protein MEPE_05548 [Melanopsichium pennsylvanicum]
MSENAFKEWGLGEGDRSEITLCSKMIVSMAGEGPSGVMTRKDEVDSGEVERLSSGDCKEGKLVEEIDVIFSEMEDLRPRTKEEDTIRRDVERKNEEKKTETKEGKKSENCARKAEAVESESQSGKSHVPYVENYTVQGGDRKLGELEIGRFRNWEI